MSAQNQLSIGECKRCAKAISTMKKPAHVSQEIFDRFSGICSSCFTEKENVELALAMKNNMLKIASKPRLIV